MTHLFDPNKVKHFAMNLAGILVGTWLFFKVFPYIAPFVFAVLLAYALEPVVSFLQNRRLPRKAATLLTLLMFLGVFSLLVAFLVVRMIGEVRGLMEILPEQVNNFYERVIALMAEESTILSGLPEELASFIRVSLGNIVEYAGTLVNDIVKGALNIAISLPSAVLFLFMTLISTYFISSDREKIGTFLQSQLPAYWITKFHAIKGNIRQSFLKLMKAYLIIMSITFTELIIAFSILQVRFALALAVIIAIADILPVVGTGGFLAPWAIYSFVTGDPRMGISLLIVYGIVLLVRQVIEPKIVGTQIGVHPVLTLGSMYVGIKLLGGIGIILGPVIFMVLRSISQVVFRHQSIKELLIADDWIKK
ncbi:sporulation integral membrane protein YtvI [Alkalibacter rhizosphaerae]|uniref:Sporulation integral membrane protein YtvI n=1 Tax=Alkalibacter rhizosphaerae TaxID=2815577 RepID=A0A974XEY8_9FIRM|nr:sporulation integral membrane protein YtvI [Alkalibacter rhizosphaerae]QSX08622.1 sporulation integral membrane protein YtvI [Alkalibacter rhizosphaerae]